ncbi:hydrolase, had superfamily, cof family [Lactobacillus selangorensis]|uniref:Hydrolase, had superfamily, cof family n=1 Tax=Lactobacillus selangorensis TaxID=81857 RepID=A0A0R2G699_9LACO|nr:Cof-type HAD-IIB family hydrolase [Lactobacillus selangorensis]KRN28842.1 hydrolase, had superfamily, cof family [Lactobacillus selangorensis]KRN32748.1 hydrolase, had superfamily, cof family [Lactobacillus selangorensis]
MKLVAVDMDGTFLNDQMDYDRTKFAQLHQKMQDQDVRFVVASGNQYYQLKSFFEDYPDVIYVAENGAYIRDLDQEYVVAHFSLETVQAILQELSAFQQLQIIVCGRHSAYVLNAEPQEYVDQMRKYYYKLKRVGSFEALDDDILKFALSCPPQQTDELVKQLRVALNGMAIPVSSGHGDIDLIQPGINKAAGLKQLGERLNIPMTEMVAFGDGGNDQEMLAEVGTGVAMSNAAPAVKEVADVMTDSNNDQGVLTYLDKRL